MSLRKRKHPFARFRPTECAAQWQCDVICGDCWLFDGCSFCAVSTVSSLMCCTSDLSLQSGCVRFFDICASYSNLWKIILTKEKCPILV